ncbi:MAG: FAD-dependent oxidoreductase [Lachnospiraceae bacterium]|nr:FAD-dependent oxidoreductase [Lachnospiraceae bacterium]
MKQQYEALFTPWKIRDLEIKNRIVLAPMGGTCIFGWMEPLGSHFDREAAKLLLNIAKNNCGLVIPGIAPVKDMLGGKWLYQNKRKFRELKEFMDEFHKTGARFFVQMTAGFGRSMALTAPLAMLAKNKVLNTIASPIIDAEYLTAAPSVLPNRWADDVTTRAITQKEIHDIVYAFGETARLCMEAGVDGVEVHAVHEGYLLDQFTLKYSNQRTDEYGGSFENRYRFAAEIVQEIKSRCGEDFPVSLRYSVRSMTKDFQYGAMPGEDFAEIGRDMEESEKAVKFLQDAGYDMLNCDNGTYDAWYWAHPPQYMPQNCNLEDVEHIRKFVDIPVVCAGRMQPEVGARAIADGGIDAMAVGRQFLADPRWVTKLMRDKEQDIRPCICCHTACFNLTKHNGTANDQDLSESAGMCRCAVNPVSMQSGKYKIRPARNPKKVAVIGGGIGGMEAARVLAMRGHDVDLYEKSSELGGIFIAAAAPDFKEKDKQLIHWLVRQIGRQGVKVHLGSEITPDHLPDADEIIIATGAEANRIPIPGAAEYAMDATDYLLEKREAGDHVVIIGGGLTGCEIALDLFRKGKHPVIVEMKDDLIAVKNMCLANTSYLRDCFKTNEVPVYLNAAVKQIGADEVLIEDKDKNPVTLPADSVIMSVGYHPTPLAEEGKHVHLLGDCRKVGNVRSAIWGAWDIAMKI